MTITTIALPSSMDDPNVNLETAPIWMDAKGNGYFVASGILADPLDEDGNPVPYVTSDPIEAQPDRLNVVVDMDGLDALAAMGLTQTENQQTQETE
jgi:hypothetical protein